MVLSSFQFCNFDPQGFETSLQHNIAFRNGVIALKVRSRRRKLNLLDVLLLMLTLRIPEEVASMHT